MDIRAIEQAITGLEDKNTTTGNVSELAALYIVREHLKNRTQTVVNGEIQREIKDILPSYMNYIKIKVKYQMNEIPEEAVMQSFEYVCREIKEFLLLLYSSTDLRKERKRLEETIKEIEKAFD